MLHFVNKKNAQQNGFLGENQDLAGQVRLSTAHRCTRGVHLLRQSMELTAALAPLWTALGLEETAWPSLFELCVSAVLAGAVASLLILIPCLVDSDPVLV